MTKEYALYKGDEHIAYGTPKELAERLGVKPETIKFYATQSYLKRVENSEKKDMMVAVCLDD